MEQNIKAIQTYYNGYHFRSRTEARWAVFFDNANIRYQYEPEGYELSDGTKYLPDFYLSDFGIFVEIKPLLEGVEPDEKQATYRKQEELCRKFRDEVGSILLMRGVPWNDVWGQLYCFDLTDSSGGTFEGSAIFVNACEYSYEGCDPILLVNDQRQDRTLFLDTAYEKMNKKVCNASMVLDYHKGYAMNMVLCDMYDFYDPNSTEMLSMAKRSAQQARFEHGEMPKKLYSMGA